MSFPLLIFGALLATTLGAPAALAAPQETGFLNRSLEFGGRTWRYQVYLPPGYTRGLKWPVLLFLHGSGERGTDGLRPTNTGLGSSLRWDPARFPGIAVFPQAPEDSCWIGAPAEFAMLALDREITEFGGDTNRVYLTGISMGGYGAWHLAALHPERFAALVVVCGGVLPPIGGTHAVRQAPETIGARDPYARAAELVDGIPCWIFHGDDDNVIPVTESRLMHTALQKLGSPLHYTEYAGVNHGCWDRAYGEPELWKWLPSQTLKNRSGR